MSINISFNGATLFKPGAYSKTSIDLGGGFPLSPTGIIAIFGESEAGTPGSSEINIANNVFSPDQLPEIRSKYKRGPIVDACNFLFAPGADGAIPGGAQAVYIYKTNASVRATLASIEAGATDFGALRAREWGVGGNQLTFKNTLTPETPATLTSAALSFPVTITLGVNDELKYMLNGDTEITATIAPGAYANVAALFAALNTAIGGALVASAGSGTDTIKYTQATGTNLQRNGWGRSFMITDGNANSDLGLTDFSFASAVSEPIATLAVRNAVTTLQESDSVGGEVIWSLGRDDSDSCSAATVTIDSTSITLSQSGATPSSYVLTKANFPTIQSLSDYVNTLSGWNSAVASTQIGFQSPSTLDQVTGVGAFYLGTTAARPARIKRDANRVANFFSLSQQVELIPISPATETKKVGLPDQQGVPNALYLSGGAKGATVSADITTALSKFEKFRVNSVVPLFSRDASDDILDTLTDGSSTYTIASIHQAVKTHLSLMATTQKKSERQGYLSIKASYDDCKEQAATLADARIQLCIQDIRQVNSDGAIQWFQPWAGACLLAGARGGSPVGNPLTFKYFNMSGIRQTAQGMSTSEQNIQIDFDPDTQYNDAIQSGLTFWESPQSGGFRLVVDNTTYAVDGNWVYNRAHVLYAADVLAYDFRTQLENIYVGLKNNVSAAEIKSTCESILSTYLAQGITVSTSDAKSGFKQLIVQLNGNVVNISVVVKLVESIDFVLADITLQRAQQTA